MFYLDRYVFEKLLWSRRLLHTRLIRNKYGNISNRTIHNSEKERLNLLNPTGGRTLWPRSSFRLNLLDPTGGRTLWPRSSFRLNLLDPTGGRTLWPRSSFRLNLLDPTGGRTLWPRSSFRLNLLPQVWVKLFYSNLPCLAWKFIKYKYWRILFILLWCFKSSI